MSTALASTAGVALSEGTPNAFDLRVPQGQAGQTLGDWFARVELRDGRLDLRYRESESPISVELAAFEEATLEYLTISGQTADWRSNSGIAPDLTAVRLRLTKAPWSWPLILWIADRKDAP